jgi:hypothetical protein
MKKLIAGLSALVILAGCAAQYTPLQQQKIYANQSVEWIETLGGFLGERYEEETESGQAYMRAEINPQFNRLKTDIRLYLVALQIWEASGEKPAGLDELKAAVEGAVGLLFEFLATAEGRP